MTRKLIAIISILALLGFVIFIINGQVFNNEDNMPMDDQITNDMQDDSNMDSSEDMMDDEMMDEGMRDEEMIDEDADMDKDIMDDESHMPMNEGPMAMEFELENLKGDMVSLSSFKGEKLYIKFWASWCTICVGGLEEVDILSQNEDFKVLTIVSPNYNGEKDTEDFKEWFKNQELDNIEVLLDEEGLITKKYGVRAYPTSVYIGSDGVLVKTLPGHMDNESIMKTFMDIE